MIKNITLILASSLISIIITALLLGSFNQRFNKLESDVANLPQIVVVDTKELYRDFVISIQESIEGSNLSEEEEKAQIAEKVEKYKTAIDLFNTEIVNIAAKNKLIILDKD